MNSKQKGKRGEREFAEFLRSNGLTARRGQQFSGSPDSPDVICEELPWIHFEIKRVESLNINRAVEQAKVDCGDKLWAVAHKRNRGDWLITISANLFVKLLWQWTTKKK